MKGFQNFSFIQAVSKGGDYWQAFASNKSCNARDMQAISLSDGYVSPDWSDFLNTRNMMKNGGVVRNVTEQTV